MPKIGDSSIQRFKYEGVTVEQWKALKQKLANDFKFPVKEDIGKHEFGSTVAEWQTGVFEWEYRIDHNAKPEIGVLEFGIRRRPFDPPQTNVEIAIAKFMESREKPERKTA